MTNAPEVSVQHVKTIRIEKVRMTPSDPPDMHWTRVTLVGERDEELLKVNCWRWNDDESIAVEDVSAKG